MFFWKKILGKAKLAPDKDRLLSEAITQIVGGRPKNLDLFKLATLHSSASKVSKNGFRESNERLEYLGDAVLNMVVAEYLFKKYPFKKEGFLTEIRSRIVKRETLNQLAQKLGMQNLVELQDKKKKSKLGKSIYGNALEAVIGAVFLDRGYPFCKKFILERIIMNHLNMEKIIRTVTNFKSRIIEWAQKENKDVQFEATAIPAAPPYNQFEVDLFINQKKVATGRGSSKKRAEQDAALKACDQLKLL